MSVSCTMTKQSLEFDYDDMHKYIIQYIKRNVKYTTKAATESSINNKSRVYVHTLVSTIKCVDKARPYRLLPSLDEC